MRKIIRQILKGLYFVMPDKIQDKIMCYLYPKTIEIINAILGTEPQHEMNLFRSYVNFVSQGK